MTDVVSILGICGGAIFIYLNLCGASIVNFASKYKLTRREVFEFLDTLLFPPSSLMKSVIKSERSYDDILDGKAQYSLMNIKMGWATAALILMIFLANGGFQSSYSAIRVVSVVLFTLFLVLLYKSWRFGHSLKSKAQPHTRLGE